MIEQKIRGMTVLLDLNQDLAIERQIEELILNEEKLVVKQPVKLKSKV